MLLKIKHIAAAFILAGLIGNSTPAQAEPTIQYEKLLTQNGGDISPAHWAAGAVREVINRKMMNAYPDARFRGERSLTRYEAAAILSGAYAYFKQRNPNLAHTPDQKTAESLFLLLRTDRGGDLEPSHWSYYQVEQVVSLGIMTGYPDGQFKGNRTISRTEFLFSAQKLAALTYINGFKSSLENASENFVNRYQVAAILAQLAQLQERQLF